MAENMTEVYATHARVAYMRVASGEAVRDPDVSGEHIAATQNVFMLGGGVMLSPKHAATVRIGLEGELDRMVDFFAKMGIGRGTPHQTMRTNIRLVIV